MKADLKDDLIMLLVDMMDAIEYFQVCNNFHKKIWHYPFLFCTQQETLKKVR